jgi:hypothetical protein
VDLEPFLTLYLSVLDFLKSLFHEIFELDFLSISNLIFTACVACKNLVQNIQKIKFRNQFCKIEILKIQVQIDRRYDQKRRPKRHWSS